MLRCEARGSLRARFLRPGATPAAKDHGTAIAALLVGESAPGAAPLAPGAQLLVGEAMGRYGDRSRADAFAIVEAMDWSVRSKCSCHRI